MDLLDPVTLSRLQFGFIVSFHILFPGFTVGLASWLVVLEGLWWRTGDPRYYRLSEFWTKIFAVSFGMGVVSGIVMSFQFGTNWSRLSDVAGNILGPLLNYEVVTAFFLEATFLGVLLFGRDRVSPGLHFFSACMVAFGTLVSSFWILASNSWLQTPAGAELGPDGRFYVTSWWEAIFNPSTPYRFAHMVTAFYLTTAFVIIGVNAWYLLKGRHLPMARAALTMGLGLVALLAPVQIFLGDMQGLNSLEHQPTKVAAMEGHWERQKGAPLILFGLPDSETETTRYAVEVPYLSSLILTHSLDGETPGIKDVPRDERPPAWLVFWTFRIMVGIGMLMLAIGFFSVYLYWKGRLYDTRWFLRLTTFTIPIGFIAILTGWYTSELGRQPWVIYGVLKTADAFTPTNTVSGLLISLAAFVLAYGVIFPAGVYYMIQMIRRGPGGMEGVAPRGERRPLRPGQGQRPKRPLSGGDESLEPQPAE